MDIPFFRPENASLGGSGYIGENPSVAIPYLTVLSVVMVTGTLGNILVICAVFYNKELSSSANLLIVNLAFADLCVTGFVDPFSIVGMVRGEEWFEDKPALCELIGSVCLTSCFCSMLTIGLIAVNRYIHICHVDQYNHIYTTHKTIAMCVGVWVVSFLAEMPNFLGWGGHVYDKKTLSCVWDRTADLSYSVFFSVFGIAIPVILIGICYGMIYRYIHTHQPVLRLLEAANLAYVSKNQDIIKQSHKMTRMVFICFVAFVICWMPYAIIVALDYSNTYPAAVHLYAILLAHSNSTVNSIIYGVTNEKFRQAYFRLLGLHRCITTPVKAAAPAVYKPVTSQAKAI